MPAQKKRTSTVKQQAVHPVDALVEKTILAHADEARVKEEREERLRLAPRRRLAKIIYAALEKEMGARNGMRLTSERKAEIAEDCAKQAVKAVGVESSKTKKAKDKD